MKRLTLILLLFSLLAACSPSGEQAAPAAETTLEPTAVVESEAPRSTTADNAELPAPVLQDVEPTTAAAAETAVVEPTIAATVAVVEPTATPEEAAADEASTADGPMVVSGRLDEGAFFRGDPNAPVTLIDYSDFL
jgi:protein-disulfide isomerase